MEYPVLGVVCQGENLFPFWKAKKEAVFPLVPIVGVAQRWDGGVR